IPGNLQCDGFAEESAGGGSKFARRISGRGNATSLSPATIHPTGGKNRGKENIIRIKNVFVTLR
ncbi:hypothetical protein, partial [Parvibaculum sp.]|uniref:hypothetical protein n=1 Tax=Parvibaculum sp. TaxID=2024848 RepID=UPI0038B28086